MAVPVSSGGPDLPTVDVRPDAVPSAEAVLGALVLVLVGALLLLLLYGLGSSVAEFVVMEAVRGGSVGLRRAARENAGRGVRLFAFRVAVWLLAGSVVVAGLGLAAGIGAVLSPALPVLLVAAALPLVAGLGSVVWLVLVLTTDLAVPVMFAHPAAPGPVAAWRYVLGVAAAEPVDVGLYLVAKFTVRGGVRVAVGVVVGLVGLVVGAPFALAAAAVLALAGGTLSTAALAALVGIGVAYGAAMLGVVQVVRTPAVVFYRTYALCTFGRIEPDLDVLGVAAPNGGLGEATP